MMCEFIDKISLNIKEMKSYGKTSFFTISTTTKQEIKPYATPIRINNDFCVTGCVIFDMKVLLSLLKLIDGKVDFILVDINFPKMDVVKFIKELRCSDKSTQIALSFSYEDIYKVLKIVEQDISKLLLNPITNSDLEKLFEVFSKRYNLNITYEISNFCVFEPNDFKIRCQNNSYSLTKKECIFLEIMFKNQKTISYQDMKEYLWKDSSMNDNVIHTFIKNIRKKLPPKTILTIKGVGYKMN